MVFSSQLMKYVVMGDTLFKISKIEAIEARDFLNKRFPDWSHISVPLCV